jgi:hypothetical protein
MMPVTRRHLAAVVWVVVGGVLYAAQILRRIAELG